MIVVRLQTVISREVPPGETAVLTVGSIRAGTTSNVIPDQAVLQLNVRTYTEGTRTTVLDAIRRIVRAECAASNCPREPEFKLFDRFPLTDNDEAATDRVAELRHLDQPRRGVEGLVDQHRAGRAGVLGEVVAHHQQQRAAFGRQGVAATRIQDRHL